MSDRCLIVKLDLTRLENCKICKISLIPITNLPNSDYVSFSHFRKSANE